MFTSIIFMQIRTSCMYVYLSAVKSEEPVSQLIVSDGARVLHGKLKGELVLYRKYCAIQMHNRRHTTVAFHFT